MIIAWQWHSLLSVYVSMVSRSRILYVCPKHVPITLKCSKPSPTGRGLGEGEIMPIYRLGLIGYPVSHSLSPKIQNAALQACGLEGDYSLFPILPDNRQGLKD